MHHLLDAFDSLSILRIFHPGVGTAAVLGTHFFEVILVENGVGVSKNAYLQIPDRFAVQFMRRINLDDRFVQHGQIGGKIPFEERDEEDDAVANLISQAGFAFAMLLLAETHEVREVVGDDRHELKYRGAALG